MASCSPRMPIAATIEGHRMMAASSPRPAGSNNRASRTPLMMLRIWISAVATTEVAMSFIGQPIPSGPQCRKAALP